MHRASPVTVIATALLTWALTLPAVAWAAGIQVHIDRSQATMQDQLQLQVTVEGSRSAEPKLPDLSAFDVQTAGTSTQLRLVNGRTSTHVQYTYHLLPKQEGTFVIGAASVSIDGQTYQSRPFQVKILPASAVPAQERGLFLWTSVNKPDPYVAEQVVYTWRFYRRLRVTNANVELPSFDGWMVEDLGEQRDYQTTINGQQYMVTEIQKALFPQRNGQVTIPGSVLRCDVVTPRQRGRRGNSDPFSGLFGDSFFGGGRSVSKVLRSEPIAMEVQPLPQPPANFSGLVGQWNLHSQLSKPSLRVGESTTLTVTVSGSGNITQITEPRITVPSTFKVYADKPSSKQHVQDGTLRGSRTFRKSLVPLQPGPAILPGLELAYFDPQQGRYRVAKAEAMRLTIAPAAAKEDLRLTEGVTPLTGKVAVTVLADDILPISRHPQELGSTPLALGPIWRWLSGLLLPPLLFVVVAWFKRRRSMSPAQLAQQRQRLARSEALRELRALQKRWASDGHGRRAANDTESGAIPPTAQQAAALTQVLQSYLGDRLTVEGRALTVRDVERLLQEAGVAQEVIAEATGFMHACEGVQYGASGDASSSERLAAQLKSIVTTIDKGLRAAVILAAACGGTLLWHGADAHAASTGVKIATMAAAPGTETEAGDPKAGNAKNAGNKPQRTLMELFVAANQAYDRQDFARATALYEHALNSYGTDAQLWFNLGNSQLRGGQLGQAIASYRRSLVLAPRNQDAIANLSYARASAKDAIAPVTPHPVLRTLFFWHYTMSRSELLWALLLGNCVLWLALAWVVWREDTQDWARWLACASIAVVVAAGASFSVRWLSPTLVGVITEAEVNVHSGTHDDTVVRFRLHAGTEAVLRDQVGDWVRVELSDGKQGWVQARQVAQVQL